MIMRLEEKRLSWFYKSIIYFSDTYKFQATISCFANVRINANRGRLTDSFLKTSSLDLELAYPVCSNGEQGFGASGAPRDNPKKNAENASSLHDP